MRPAGSDQNARPLIPIFSFCAILEGEQEAKMYDFTRTSPFDEQQIETLRQRLTRMDRAALIRFYNSSLQMCLLTREKLPRAPYLQQLVQAWKEMAQRERASVGTEPRASIPATLPGIDKEQPQKRPRVAQAAKAEEDALLSTLPLFATGNPALNESGLHPVDTPMQQA
jgi:hypothetical protein